ncbi:PepSY-associated TM helix domain-containing protein [Deinococcus radiomollis]|uniref:PepSY-associated TM helix domain-containing protein n=1 Tax=Deinococcus radiomollis TaxID=468916 RepID=UPI003891DF96
MPEAAPAQPVAPRVRAPRPLKARVNVVLRWLHIYTSMVSLLVVLFFALTGITLNHPDWVFGNQQVTKNTTGTLPSGWQQGGKPDWLTVVEYLRANAGVKGQAGEYVTAGSADPEDLLSFHAPGYSADVFIAKTSGTYRVSVTQQGFVAVLNDFHKGRDSGGAWAWVIDVSGGFLALIAVTGLGLLLYMKKIRRAALLTMLGGAALIVVLMKLAS